ncbi:MAG: hypothetical protein H6702_07050 [Myxococcales bacterium]|nr:hypothetical protein [Myxococcales bacterium]
MSLRIYRALAAGGPAQPLPVPAMLRRTPGGRLMLDRRPQRFPQLFGAFRASLLPGWRWRPEAQCEPGALLDGASSAGDAHALARELALLATAPAPFGLGLSVAQVQVVTYRGEGRGGFLAEHSRTGVLGLASDVVAKDASPTDLRRWQSHALVAWQGRFYDPAYGHVYARLGEAADYSLDARARELDGARWRAGHDRLRRPVWFLEEGARLRGPYTQPPRGLGPA